MKPELRQARRVALIRLVRDMVIVFVILTIIGYLVGVGVIS